MVLVIDSCMAAVFHSLQVFGQLHLSVEQPVFVDIFLVFNLVRVSEFGSV